MQRFIYDFQCYGWIRRVLAEGDGPVASGCVDCDMLPPVLPALPGIIAQILMVMGQCCMRLQAKV